MTKVLKAGALWLAITVVVWLFTIWHWQSSRHEASTAEIVGQLFALPVVLTAFFLLVLWAVQRLRAQASAPVVPVVGPKAGVPAVTANPTQGVSDEAQRQLSAWVLAEAVTLPAGSDASAAWSGLQSQSVRPELDSELQDINGLPIFTSRVADLDVRDWLDAHAELAQGGIALPDEVLRGLALLEAPLHQMLNAVSELVPADGGAFEQEAQAASGGGVSGSDMKSHLSGVAVPVNKAAVQARAALAPQLTVRLLLPSSWGEHERAAVVEWVRSQCGALLDWADATRAKGVRWLVEALERPEDLWDELDRQMVQWSREPRPELWLILAVDSAVNEARIERMQAVGELFTSSHQTGKVPGEAAAGLLLANEHWPDLAQRAEPPVRMWRPVRASRDKSADAIGRVGSTVLGAALQHAFSLNLADKDRVLVVADADHRASRTAELFEALQDVMPGVDPMLAVTRVGESCGDLGVARALVPSALACAALRAGDKPDQVAVATHVQSSHDRVVVALAPWRAEPVAA
ncbi:MAG: hypothetical protein EPO09_10895 [Aquabacterium sp.]|uniref:hypothetical protein n=1 Tax=Aquabacterium sp. TaxID=1872578 RepID=UPI00120A068F|nr:hypothetical protein [Aquabacterium sp.]TAK93966.1 MAG: hypothetical protein EPO09_10895 [Aquabacterium sp.]